MSVEQRNKRLQAVDKAVWEAENNWDGSCYTITKETFDDLLVLATEAARTLSGAAWNEDLTKAIETLAASRHLIGKYTPDHHWLPEHDKRIEELRALVRPGGGEEQDNFMGTNQ